MLQARQRTWECAVRGRDGDHRLRACKRAVVRQDQTGQEERHERLCCDLTVLSEDSSASCMYAPGRGPCTMLKRLQARQYHSEIVRCMHARPLTHLEAALNSLAAKLQTIWVCWSAPAHTSACSMPLVGRALAAPHPLAHGLYHFCSTHRRLMQAVLRKGINTRQLCAHEACFNRSHGNTPVIFCWCCTQDLCPKDDCLGGRTARRINKHRPFPHPKQVLRGVYASCTLNTFRQAVQAKVKAGRWAYIFTMCAVLMPSQFWPPRAAAQSTGNVETCWRPEHVRAYLNFLRLCDCAVHHGWVKGRLAGIDFRVRLSHCFPLQCAL